MPKPFAEFTILETHEPKYLRLMDASMYYQTENNPAVIQLTPPGANEPISAYWVKNAINTFNSSNLGLSCFNSCDNEYLDLPDGLWLLKLKLSPDTIYSEKYYLKTDLLELDLDKIYVKINLEYDPFDKKFREWYIQVNMFLDAAKANTRKGDIGRAKDFYDKCVSLIDQYKECDNCY